MLRQNLTVFVLLAMVATAAATLFLPVETTEAGAITVYSGTEYYTCYRRADNHECQDKERPYSESYEPFSHRLFHNDHTTEYVNRNKYTTDTVSSCSGCCAPW